VRVSSVRGIAVAVQFDRGGCGLAAAQAAPCCPGWGHHLVARCKAPGAVPAGTLIADNPLNVAGVKSRTFRLPTQGQVRLRQLGPRDLDQVAPLELATVVCNVATNEGWDNEEALFRSVLLRLGRARLSGQASVLLRRLTPLARSLAAEADTGLDSA
jgi:hypothetical protein